MQAAGGEVLDCGQTDAVGAGTDDLDGAGEEQLSLMTAPLTAANGAVLGPVTDRGFVDFHQTEQRLAVRIDHGVAELGAQQPGRLVRAQAELFPQLKGRDAIGMGGHQIGGPQPDDQAQLAAVHEGPGRHRGLPTALLALIRPGLGVQPPGPVMTTAGAAEPIRPAQVGEVGRARGLVGKASLKSDQRAGKIGHGIASGTFVHDMFLSCPWPSVINILSRWKLGDKPLVVFISFLILFIVLVIGGTLGLFASGIKRLHDMAASGWWMLVMFLPLNFIPCLSG